MYDELLKQIDNCHECLCGECRYHHLQRPSNFVRCMDALMMDAKNAIEEISKELMTCCCCESPKEET